MPFFRFSTRHLLSFAAVAAPLAIASSAAPSFAQTIEPARIQAPIPASIELPQAAPAVQTTDPLAPATAEPDPRQVECVAKIIMHEAANQPREGRVAVAQVIRTRMHDRRFAADACAVARQRGQFFDVDAYDPPRTGRWDDAVAIATDTLSGAGDELAPGALFFHSAYSPMPGRVRVAQIGGHVFYR